MIKKILSLIIIFSTISFSNYATNIAVIDVEYIINNNEDYLRIIDNIEIQQKKTLNIFNIQEDELEQLLNNIESSKLLLNDQEINDMINSYNNKLKKFKLEVDEFNLHYQNQILKIKKFIIQEIIVLLENYAKTNKIDLVLDSNSYLIAENSINITNNIKAKLDNMKLNLEFENFE